LQVPLKAGADVALGSMGQRAWSALFEVGVGLIRGEPKNP
jgi:hypothetical protein